MEEKLKPAKYFLGDPTIVLPDKIFHGIWGELYNYEVGKFYINDTDMCVHHTHYGDGIFEDTRNRQYKVDGGVIGLVDIKLIEDITKCKDIGHIFEFKEPVKFYYENGIFFIKSGKKYIKISTQFEEELEIDEENDDVNFDNLCNESDDDFIEEENETDIDNITDMHNNNNITDNKQSYQFFKKK